MCTLVVLYRHVADAPLIVAANRDEYLDRPSGAPALHEAEAEAIKADTEASTATATTRENPGKSRQSERGSKDSSGHGGDPEAARRGAVLAPIDLRAGGTWLGINASGVFAAVTNRQADAPDPTRRSRGKLVMDALNAPTAELAAGRIERLHAATYNPFNLLVADGRSAHLLTYGRAPERIDLSPGIHVIGNVHPKEGSPKVRRIEREVEEAIPGPGDQLLDRMAALCRRHVGSDPLAATCVHAGGYGTRSSTLLRTGASPELLYAEGAPCANPYGDFTPTLRALLRPSAQGITKRKIR